VLTCIIYILHDTSNNIKEWIATEPFDLVDAFYTNTDHKKFEYWGNLGSSGQSFWLQIQTSRVRFPALPDILKSSGSATGSTQAREYN
jgi:hypothetical protein